MDFQVNPSTKSAHRINRKVFSKFTEINPNRWQMIAIKLRSWQIANPVNKEILSIARVKTNNNSGLYPLNLASAFARIFTSRLLWENFHFNLPETSQTLASQRAIWWWMHSSTGSPNLTAMPNRPPTSSPRPAKTSTARRTLSTKCSKSRTSRLSKLRQLKTKLRLFRWSYSNSLNWCEPSAKMSSRSEMLLNLYQPAPMTSNALSPLVALRMQTACRKNLNDTCYVDPRIDYD